DPDRAARRADGGPRRRAPGGDHGAGTPGGRRGRRRRRGAPRPQPRSCVRRPGRRARRGPGTRRRPARAGARRRPAQRGLPPPARCAPPSPHRRAVDRAAPFPGQLGGPPVIRRVLAVSALVLAGTFGTSAPALAAASVTVSGPDGAAAVPTAGGTVTVTGRGFTSVKAGFGGIYVAFGWVDDAAGGSWRPSRGGITGQDYRYIPDSESRDNAGRLRYVAFPGSSTAAEANGGSLTEDGRFRVRLSIPGPRFSATDRNGRTVEVDCTTVQCGVLTLGAHGVANADNETFTPVRFTAGATRTSDTEREPNARTGSGGPASNGATSGGVATDGQESDPSAPT